VSVDNVESLRRAIAAYNVRDIEALIGYCHEGIEFHSAFGAVGGADYDGHDGLRAWNRDVEDAWGEEVRVELETLYDLDEHVLAFYVLRGRGRQSGVPVAMPVALVTRWRDDLIVYMRGHADRDDALRELGVSSEQLEPIEP
jgi:ketosteroid isomerase-like protein